MYRLEHYKITRLSIKSIIQVEHPATVVPEVDSRFDYFSMSDSNFCVLSDQTTALGVLCARKYAIVKDCLANRAAPIVAYPAGPRTVYTIIADEARNALLAGSLNPDKSGQVVHYDLGTGQTLKNYGPARVPGVFSGTRFQNLCFLSQPRSNVFVVIDTITKSVLHQSTATAIQTILSLAVCRVSDKANAAKAVLLVAGIRTDCSEDRSRLYDVTGLVDRFGYPEPAEPDIWRTHGDAR